MKTIKEAANDEYKKYKNSPDIRAEDIAISFRKGTEFSQRWIPVDEELPIENKRKEIIMKTKLNLLSMTDDDLTETEKAVLHAIIMCLMYAGTILLTTFVSLLIIKIFTTTSEFLINYTTH